MESDRSETRGLGTADKRESKTEHVRVILLLPNVVQTPMTQSAALFTLLAGRLHHIQQETTVLCAWSVCTTT